MSVKRVRIGGKVSDMCFGALFDDKGKLVEEHDGYVPNIKALGGGDYLRLEIDNATGQILNWKPIQSFS